MKQDFIKIFHPEFQPFVCQNCKKEISLSPFEVKRLCLLSYSDLKKQRFNGLCPECTNLWLRKNKPSRGKGAIYIGLDEL